MTVSKARVDQIVQEPELHRRYLEYYAYGFFIARRPPVGSMVIR